MKKLIYLVTEDWYFHSHRLPMMRGAQEAGFDVCVICNVDKHRAAIEALGVRVIPLDLKRRSLNPFSALRPVFEITAIYRREKPDLVHHLAMKPIIFGSIAAVLAGVPRVLNAFVGLGVIFHSNIVLARALRFFLVPALRVLLRRRGMATLFQNTDDRNHIQSLGMIDPARTFIIRGSGVDIDQYPVRSLPPVPPFICAYAGRMIGMKGLQTMHDAFEILRRAAPQVQLWLCGTPDPANPQSWDDARLNAWTAQNAQVQWRGHQSMADIWPLAHVALQPTIGGEGLPKALLEAGACGRAMIATDVPGCREVVQPGVNGILVPQEDPQALAKAILQLADDPTLCARMGLASRVLIERDFSAARVQAQIRDLYNKLMTA